MEPILELKNVCKSYKDHHVVRNLSFSVGRGTPFALLGANGEQ